MSYRNLVRYLIILPFFAVIVTYLSGCVEERWDGVVITETDELTDKPTGFYKTYGPTRNIAFDDLVVPVTVGYWCHVIDMTYDLTKLPLMVKDQLFFRFSSTDTSSNIFSHQDFPFGQVTRMAVDKEIVPAFFFDDTAFVTTKSDDTYFYNRAYTFVPYIMYFKGDKGVKFLTTLLVAGTIRQGRKDKQVSDYQAGLIAGRIIKSGYWHEMFNVADVINGQSTMPELVQGGRIEIVDRISANYLTGDTLSVDMGVDVLRFPLYGFAEAVANVRDSCPVEKSIEAWNVMADSIFDFVECIDSMSQDSMSQPCGPPSILRPSHP